MPPLTAYPVELSIDYKKVNIRSERHDYQLRVTLLNKGTQPIKEWHVDVVVPTCLLEQAESFALRVPDRSDEESTLFRASQDTHPSAIYPEDTKLVMTVDYRINQHIFQFKRGVLDERITAKAYVHGELAAVAEQVAC